MLSSLNILDNFFFLSDSGKLFEPGDDKYYTDIRAELRDALVDILFWHRPELEVLRGISWVYEGFKHRVKEFEEKAGTQTRRANRADISFPGRHHDYADDAHSHDKESSISRQAVLFLALLPFPGQWKWIDTMTISFPNDPEVQKFLKKEQDTIQRKLAKKSIKKLKLKNFCQILKAPNLPGEKGVLRIFSIPYLFFSFPEILKKISSRYILYVEPAAGINFRHSWMRIYSQLYDPVLFGAASREDADFLASQPGIITTHLAHGDYLEILPSPPPLTEDSRIQKPSEGEKEYDIVFNNTFDEMDRKRHYLMLDLMDHPLLKSIKVLFLGRGSEPGLKKIRQEIKRRGLEKRTALVANIMRREVPAYLEKCRAGVHLALQENGCRAVYEYFRADLPCVISSATAGMNMDIINSRTGIVARDEQLANAIAKVLEKTHEFAPRAWFTENSGSSNSTEKLNSRLKSLFSRLGYTWSADIVQLTSSGPGRYASKKDKEKFKPLFDQLYGLFDLSLSA